MYNQTGFLILAAILLTAVVSIALIDFKGANAQGDATGGAKNITKNATGPESIIVFQGLYSNRAHH